MKYLSIALSLAIIILATTVPFTTFAGGDIEETTPQLLLLTLNSPANNSIITQNNCDFTFTPTVLGSDKCYSANLIISSGNDVISGFSQYYKTNQTAIINATYNTISFTFIQNGTYSWNVRLYNSTHSILAAEKSTDGTEKPVSYVLHVAINEPSTSPTPTPTPNPTLSPSPSPTPTITPYPTQSPTVSPTVTSAPTATSTPNPSPSSSPTPDPTPTLTPTASPSTSPSPTVNPSTTPVPTTDPSLNPTLTPTPTPSPTQTSNPTANPTNNVTPTIRPSPTPAKTVGPNQTVTPTPTVIPSQNPTPQPTEKPFSLSPEQTLLVEILVFLVVDALLLLGFRHYLVKSPKNVW